MRAGEGFNTLKKKKKKPLFVFQRTIKVEDCWDVKRGLECRSEGREGRGRLAWIFPKEEH